jgi:hypothetical protein
MISRPSYKAFKILHVGLSLIPLGAGLDKFFHFLVNWDKYLAPRIGDIVSHVMPVDTFMKIGGAGEICLGLMMIFKPRLGGLLFAAAMWSIVANFIIFPGYFDIAVRDFGLSLGGLALMNLAKEFERPAHATSV